MMTLKAFSLLPIPLLLLACGCSSSGGYQNPEPFDENTMALVMIDQGVYVKTVDDIPYNVTPSLWEGKKGLQKNLILTSGIHVLGVSREVFAYSYGIKVTNIEFSVDPGKVYRLRQQSGGDHHGVPMIYLGDQAINPYQR